MSFVDNQQCCRRISLIIKRFSFKQFSAYKCARKLVCNSSIRVQFSDVVDRLRRINSNNVK
jgi:hypothetical protein